MLDLNNRPEEQWAHLSNPNRANEKLAVFVHGFIGNYFTTWGRLPTLLESHAETSSPFDTWDYSFIGYDSNRVPSYLDIAGIIRTTIENALEGRGVYKRRYTRLALFGHSLGTLGIRQLLCAWDLHKPDFVPKLHSITFFGTPLNGSPLAHLRPLLPWWPILDGLKANCPQLRMLASWTKSVYPHRGWPPVMVITGLDDHVVGHIAEFVNWAGDRVPYKATNFDHRDIKKPTAWTSSMVIDEIREALKP